MREEDARGSVPEVQFGLVRNPLALATPELGGLIERACASIGFAAPHGAASCAPEILDYVTNPTMGMVVGWEDGAPRAIALFYEPDGMLFPYPMVTLIYNEGRPSTFRAMVRWIADHLRERGWSEMWTINGSGRADEVWLRAMTPKGVRADVVGSVVMFTVEEGADDGEEQEQEQAG